MKLVFFSFRTLTLARLRLIVFLWLCGLVWAGLGSLPVLSVVREATEYATLTSQYSPLPGELGLGLMLGLHEGLEPLGLPLLLFVALNYLWSIFVMGGIYGFLEREAQGATPPVISGLLSEGGRLFTRAFRMMLGGWGLTLLLMVPGLVLRRFAVRMQDTALLETSVMWVEGLATLTLLAGFLLGRVTVELARAQVLVTGGSGVLRGLWRALGQVFRQPIRLVGGYVMVLLVPLVLFGAAMVMRMIGAETDAWPVTLQIVHGYLGLLWWWMIPVTLAAYARQCQESPVR